MKPVKVATWNAEGMFTTGSMTRRGTPEEACLTIGELDADVIVIPEFGIVEPIDAAVATRLSSMGYKIFTTIYRQDRVLKGYGLAILSRLPVLTCEKFQLGDNERDAISLTIRSGSNSYRVIGVHFDDRYEQVRLSQAHDVLEYINKESAPTIVMGDFNAMRNESSFARFARKPPFAWFAALKKRQETSIVRRVHEMAKGSIIKHLEASGIIHDLDSRQCATISAKQRGLELMPNWPFAKIDWIFGSKGFTATSYKVMRDVGSDHRPVVATLCYDANVST